jgi:hypothetical protein
LRERMAEIDRAALPTVEQAVEQKRRELQRPALAVPAPEPVAAVSPAKRELDPAAADIQLACSQSRNAQEFVQALGDQGIHLAIATVAEAERTQFQVAAAKGQDPNIPSYQAGEFVVVNSAGKVITLDAHTTGEQHGQAGKLLATLDRGQFQGIEATQEEIALHAEKFIALTQTTGREAVAGIAKKVVEVVENFDWRRAVTDPDYRREFERQHEHDQPQIQPERGRGGPER